MIAEITSSGRIPNGSATLDKTKPVKFTAIVNATKTAISRGKAQFREIASASIKIRMTTKPMGGPNHTVRPYAKSNFDSFQ